LVEFGELFNNKEVIGDKLYWIKKASTRLKPYRGFVWVISETPISCPAPNRLRLSWDV
jgi:hypothetical protein